MKRTRTKTVNDRRQLALFDLPEPDENELIRRFYAQLRGLGITLSYDRDNPEIVAKRMVLGVPNWVSPFVSRHYQRIIVDLLRVEYGIVPEIERHDLAGGAQLIQLPGRRDLDLDPPVAGAKPAGRPQRGGAA
jgi:hypothetical protein